MGHAYTDVPGMKQMVCICCDNCGACGPFFESGKTLEEITLSDQQAINGWNNHANFRPTKKVAL